MFMRSVGVAYYIIAFSLLYDMGARTQSFLFIFSCFTLAGALRQALMRALECGIIHLNAYIKGWFSKLYKSIYI